MVPFAHSLGYENLAVDLGAFGAKKIGKKFNAYENLKQGSTSFDGTSDKGIKYRDEVMHEIITTGIQQNAVLIVDASHLIGLKNKSFINHQVLFINAKDFISKNLDTILKQPNYSYNDFDTKVAYQFLLTDKSVFHPKEERLDGIEYFWHPVKIIQAAKRIHESYINEINTNVMPSIKSLCSRVVVFHRNPP